MAVNAKARVAQSIGFHSITAAAEVSVTFGSCFSWWIARLLAWWGSSAAQRDGVSGDDFRSPQGRHTGPPTVPRLRKPPCRAADSRPFPLHRKPVTAHGTRPPGFAPKTMARQTQAQKLNRSGNDFLPIQGPSGPGLNCGTSLRFCAPEVSGNFSGGSPVNGVQGGANMGA